MSGFSTSTYINIDIYKESVIFCPNIHMPFIIDNLKWKKSSRVLFSMGKKSFKLRKLFFPKVEIKGVILDGF